MVHSEALCVDVFGVGTAENILKTKTRHGAAFLRNLNL